MATVLVYSVADFQPFTVIVSADMNAKLNDIKNRLNWAGGTDATTGLGDDNIQSAAVSGGGLTRATKLKAGTASHVLINDGAGAMSSEAQLAATRGGTGISPSFSGNAGKAVVVNSGETAFELGSPLQDSITESFAGWIATLTAGEAISIRDTTCLDVVFNASGAYQYRIFKADYTKPSRRRSFLGFALAAATVTPGVYTWVASAPFVASNSISFGINGRTYVVPFNTNNSTTLSDVATMMATDPDVNGAVSNGTNTVTVTGNDGLHLWINNSVVTGGVSQPTITVTATTPASGQNVQIKVFGPLNGFTALNLSSIYYVDSAGAISNTPADTNPIQVGQAISDTVLLINSNQFTYQFGSPLIFVKSHGSSTAATSGGTQSVEHFNYISWANGQASSAGARSGASNGDKAFQGFHHQIDGADTGGSAALLFQRYNKTSWTSLSNRAAAVSTTSGTAFNNYLYVARNDSSGNVDKWDGVSWSVLAAAGTVTAAAGCFTYAGDIHFSAGNASVTHFSIDSSDTSNAETNSPFNNPVGGSSATATAGYTLEGPTGDSYKWAGSWGSAETAIANAITNPTLGGASGFNQVSGLAVVNGGNDGSSAIDTTQTYNDVSWGTAADSLTARAGCYGSTI